MVLEKDRKFLISSFRCVQNIVCFLLGNSPASDFTSHLPMKMEQIECSETSAYINQTPGNYAKKINYKDRKDN